MTSHKFFVGQRVHFVGSVPIGVQGASVFTITRQMPVSGAALTYRVREEGGDRERAAGESELAACG